MRICFIADATSIHTRRWINHFARAGHEVHLVSRRIGPGFEGLDESIRVHPLIRLLPLPQVSPLAVSLSAGPWLLQVRRLVARIAPEIVHAHFIGVPGYLAAASGFRPLVLTAWGSDLLLVPRHNPVFRLLTGLALKKADRVICVSAALKEEAMKLGAAPDRVEVTPIGVDTSEFSPALRDASLRSELGAGDSPLVISTRSLEPVYDVGTLVRAVPVVLEKVPQARFVIAGDGELRGRLESLARDLGVGESVRFAGWIADDDFPAYLASSDVYVSTSLSDGTSVSLLEALASGLAPVVTDIPANRPWVKDGENGFLFPTGDHKALAGRIVLLLEKNDLRSRFGELGRRVVTEGAEWDNQMTRVAAMYEDLKQRGRLK